MPRLRSLPFIVRDLLPGRLLAAARTAHRMQQLTVARLVELGEKDDILVSELLLQREPQRSLFGQVLSGISRVGEGFERRDRPARELDQLTTRICSVPFLRQVDVASFDGGQHFAGFELYAQNIGYPAESFIGTMKTSTEVMADAKAALESGLTPAAAIGGEDLIEVETRWIDLKSTDVRVPLAVAWEVLRQHGQHVARAKRRAVQMQRWRFREIHDQLWPANGFTPPKQAGPLGRYMDADGRELPEKPKDWVSWSPAEVWDDQPEATAKKRARR